MVLTVHRGRSNVHDVELNTGVERESSMHGSRESMELSKPVCDPVPLPLGLP